MHLSTVVSTNVTDRTPWAPFIATSRLHMNGPFILSVISSSHRHPTFMPRAFSLGTRSNSLLSGHLLRARSVELLLPHLREVILMSGNVTYSDSIDLDHQRTYWKTCRQRYRWVSDSSRSILSSAPATNRICTAVTSAWLLHSFALQLTIFGDTGSNGLATPPGL